MAPASTEQLAEDVDTAIRGTYCSLRVALHKLEMNMVLQTGRDSSVQNGTRPNIRNVH